MLRGGVPCQRRPAAGGLAAVETNSLRGLAYPIPYCHCHCPILSCPVLSSPVPAWLACPAPSARDCGTRIGDAHRREATGFWRLWHCGIGIGTDTGAGIAGAGAQVMEQSGPYVGRGTRRDEDWTGDLDPAARVRYLRSLRSQIGRHPSRPSAVGP